ncbi:chorismate lyase [Thalassolituus sp.]|jgi:chorismate--pyruvate lyase|uniref:chorismate--pyruvate lyase family protein n=1 Tax=Thalassolituus sp. TaxID=2030822 RepID=UPI003518A21E|nr:MAG: chorismate--pyruvate lyase [Thalassolituus sp.]
MLRAMKHAPSVSPVLHPLSPKWSCRARLIPALIPTFWRSWLFDPGSLTARLSALRPGQFRVRCQREGYGFPTALEQAELSLSGSDRVWYREVVLMLGEHELVHARTAVPLRSLRGPVKRLQHLGNRSLGGFLFSQPSLRRTPLKASRCSPEADGLTWCRRSVFYIHQQPLMVTEAFSPDLKDFI